MKVKSPKSKNMTPIQKQSKKAKTPKQEIGKQSQKMKQVQQENAPKNFNLFVTSKSLHNESDNVACMKKAVKAVIQSAEGSRLASIGSLRFQYSTESEAIAALKKAQNLNLNGVDVKVSMASESYDPKRRCLYVGRDVNLDILTGDVKKAFKAENIKPIKKFHKFAGLLMLTFNTVELAAASDKIKFNYGGELRQCRPCLKFRKPEKAKELLEKKSEPVAKKQKLNNGDAADAKKKNDKKVKKQKVEVQEESEEEEDDDDDDEEEETNGMAVDGDDDDEMEDEEDDDDDDDDEEEEDDDDDDDEEE